MWTLQQRIMVSFFFTLLVVGAVCLVLGIAFASSKWLTSAGLILDVAGIVQLEVSGLFDRVVEHYSDDQKYPYGPPSFITRKIIHNPDTPIRSALRGALLFDHKIGFYLIVIGFFLQLSGVWV
jgi:hypothetical protein